MPTKTQHIEDTATQPSLPSNPIPVVSRLQELIAESHTNDPNILMKDLRIRKCLFLLNMQFIYDERSSQYLQKEQELIKQLERNEVIEMTFEEWEQEFHPQQNGQHVRQEFGGCLYETYGRDLDFVCRQPDEKIWTLVNTDSGNPVIIEGYHRVNRLGYFLTAKPYNSNKQYEVILDS